MSKANNSPIHLPVEQLPQANWVSIGQEPCMLLNTQQVRRLEEIAFEHMDSFLFMQAAGLRSAQKITEILSSSPHQIERILVLTGLGNNGGDACIVALKLHQQGFQVELWVFHPRKGCGTHDRNAALTQCRTANLEEKTWGDAPFTLTENTLIIDGYWVSAAKQPPLVRHKP